MGRVLIVDDSAFMRTMIRCILEKEGFAVVGEAKNGVDCLEIFKQHQPDLVTMDITMQQMDGIAALKTLREISPEVKVIMVSALGQKDIVKEAIVNGAKSFVVKPFTEEHFVSALKKLEHIGG